ncbi:MAG: C25 family cysteine peptidase [Paludibacter sp.]|nr:C25 family cysteine peptidase [Paludibacter sp.]
MKNVEFKTGEIVQGTITKNGAIYDYVQLRDGRFQQTVGNPDLPVFHYTFYIPKNEKAIGVTYKSKKQEVILLNNDLMPSQRPIPTGISERDTVFSKPNKLIYESNNVYPAVQARIYKTDYLDGDLKLVTVEVCPMQYYSKSKKIIYSSQFEIKLETMKDDNSDASKIHPKKRDKSISDMLSLMVENPESVTMDIDKISNLSSTTSSKVISRVASSSWNVPFYEYVIVTSNALKTSFTELMTWKRLKGYNAGIVAIEDILADPMATGDVKSNLNDDAGKLRQYLSAGYAAGITKYALLGGDYSVLPIRYGCGGSNSWNYGTAIDAQKIPSDLYFSDFNGNWNKDGDIYTGEQYGDSIDYAPEIYVGRLLCNSNSDVTTWTKKQLKYEKNPGNGNFSYLGRALFTEADQLQQGQEASYIKSYLPSFIKANTVILSEQPSYSADWPTEPKGPNVISNINSNLYGLLSNFNHGSPIDYGTATHGCVIFGRDVHSNVVAFDALDLDDNILYSASPEPNNGFDNLTNYDHPAVFYSVSCTNTPFDDYGTPLGSRNLGESFTCANNGGGIAYLGNTRYGWVTSSSYLYKAFLEKLTITNNLGKAEALSKLAYPYHWLQLTHNLVGCPETPMWTAAPTTFSSATVSLSGTTLTVNAGANGAKICVTSAADGGQSYYQVIENVSSNTFTNVPTSYKVVITKTNYIPYIYESDCYIQNETFTGVTTINAKNIWVGENVTTSKPTGSVIIQTGANVTINSDDTTNLMNGFEVQLGGQLDVK